MIESEYRKRNPWPRMYDVSLDEFRDVTQVDVDRMEAVAQAYGRLRAAFKAAHEEVMRAINQTGKST